MEYECIMLLAVISLALLTGYFLSTAVMLLHGPVLFCTWFAQCT